jgi:hypothetical protein
MPTIKTGKDYIDDVHAALEKHYKITIPKRVVKKVIDQTQLSIISHLKQGDQVVIHPILSLTPYRPRCKTINNLFIKKVVKTK